MELTAPTRLDSHRWTGLDAFFVVVLRLNHPVTHHLCSAQSAECHWKDSASSLAARAYESRAITIPCRVSRGLGR